MAKTPEHICRFLVGLYNPKGVKPRAYKNTVFTFEGVVQTLVGRCDELLTAHDLEPDDNRVSESNFVHAFRDGVLTDGRTAAAQFFPNYKEQKGRQIVINLPLSETDRKKALDAEFDSIKAQLGKLSEEALLKKAHSFHQEISDFDNPYLWFLAKTGRAPKANLAKDPPLTNADQHTKKGSDQHKEPMSVVLYGPPGTGKTIIANSLSWQILNGKEINLDAEKLSKTFVPKNSPKPNGPRFFATQFHPSFSYEDFFEGLRPINTLSESGSDVSYVVVPGIFKVVSQLARAYYQPKKFGIHINARFRNEPNGKKGWLLDDGITGSIYKFNERPGYFQLEGETVAFTGGKAGTINEDTLPEKSGCYPLIWYYDGPEEASPFVLFIDELNRGNPARIFGEALSLIEDSKRINASEASELVLPYSHESFQVPPNLNIICAMNSSDKSLSNLDQAFRRRFKFVYLSPSFDVVLGEDFRKITNGIFPNQTLMALKNHFSAINSALKLTRVPQENFIGHYYLFKVLRDSFGLDDKIKKANTQPRTPIEEIVRTFLQITWENDLHSQIRDIVGDLRLKEFAEHFSKESEKVKGDPSFLKTQENIETALFRYLDNIQPLDSAFPWKAA